MALNLKELQSKNFVTVGEVFVHFGTDYAAAPFATVLEAAGAAPATSPTLFGLVSDADLEGVMDKVTDMPVLAKARVRQVLAACRLISAPVPPPVKPEPLPLTKFKLSQVVNQASDIELTALDGPAIKVAYDRYRAVFGTHPPPSEEITGEQLTAVKAMLDADMAPYVDFAVWGPFGNRLAKKLKLNGVTFNSSGALIPLELSGPPSHDQWHRAFLCLRTALVSWGAVELGRLDKYSGMIGRYCERYGASCWLQIYQADVRCRGEHMERIRRRGDEARAKAEAAGGSHPLDPARPWDWVWGEACDDVAFWRVELEEPALLALTRGRMQPGLATQNLATPLPTKRVMVTDDAGPFPKVPKIHSVNGNVFTSNRKGHRICVGYNEGTCMKTSNGRRCPKDSGAIHQCNRCLSDGHGAQSCPRTDHPATKEPPAPRRPGGRGGKGKGRGKGKYQY